LLDANPDELNQQDLSWKRDTDNKSLNPTDYPDGTKPAPDYILEMMWLQNKAVKIAPNMHQIGKPRISSKL
jgi:hypothetical protein